MQVQFSVNIPWEPELGSCLIKYFYFTYCEGQFLGDNCRAFLRPYNALYVTKGCQSTEGYSKGRSPLTLLCHDLTIIIFCGFSNPCHCLLYFQLISVYFPNILYTLHSWFMMVITNIFYNMCQRTMCHYCAFRPMHGIRYSIADRRAVNWSWQCILMMTKVKLGRRLLQSQLMLLLGTCQSQVCDSAVTVIYCV